MTREQFLKVYESLQRVREKVVNGRYIGGTGIFISHYMDEDIAKAFKDVGYNVEKIITEEIS